MVDCAKRANDYLIAQKSSIDYVGIGLGKDDNEMKCAQFGISQ